jgi:predicted permease
MLTIGFGATTTIFGVVNSVLIKPLPYPDSDALVRIVHAIGGTDQPYFNDQIFTTYEEGTRTLADVGVWSPAATATITGLGDPEEVRTLRASQGLLTTLGTHPEIGRVLSAADDAPGAPDVAILTYGYWQRTFGGDPRVLERTLTINGSPHQIVGVMPAGFRFGGDNDLILPLRINRGRMVPFFRLLGVARLKPDVTLEQANADAARILRTWLVDTGQNDPAYQARYQPALRPLKQDVVGDIGTTLWVLMVTIGLVLLMACANVANLLLVRADARRQEFAIRAALGARWTRLARVLLIESLTLAMVGGTLGVALAYASLRLLVVTGSSNLPRLSEISMDPVVLVAALVLSLTSGLFSGLVPILKYAGPRLADAAGTGRSATLSREGQRAQHTLVTVQIALALVLVVSAGLMIRSFQALLRVDPGFRQPEQVQTFGLSISAATEPDAQRTTFIQQAILDRIAAIPGVASAAFTTRLPMDPTDRWSAALTAEGKPDDGRTPPNRQVKVISPGMFQTLGTLLIAGREFTWTDLYEVRNVAIISENLAREFWGSAAAALGKRVREYYGPPDGPWREIIGVARDVHDDGAHQPPPATVYWPGRLNTAGYQPRRVSVAIRTERAGTESLLNQVHEAVWSVNSNLPLAQVRTLDTLYDQSMAQTSFVLVMLAVAGAMALLLGMCGIYGVIAYAVSKRRREIGIRVALGAQASEIVGLFVRRGVIVATLGVAIGLGGAAAFTRVMRSLLFGISPFDPITFAAIPVLLVSVAVLASYLPARRALAVDPVEAMRTE